MGLRQTLNSSKSVQNGVLEVSVRERLRRLLFTVQNTPHERLNDGPNRMKIGCLVVQSDFQKIHTRERRHDYAFNTPPNRGMNV
jgi:hypothetical protein